MEELVMASVQDRKQLHLKRWPIWSVASSEPSSLKSLSAGVYFQSLGAFSLRWTQSARAEFTSWSTRVLSILVPL